MKWLYDKKASRKVLLSLIVISFIPAGIWVYNLDTKIGQFSMFSFFFVYGMFFVISGYGNFVRRKEQKGKIKKIGIGGIFEILFGIVTLAMSILGLIGTIWYILS